MGILKTHICFKGCLVSTYRYPEANKRSVYARRKRLKEWINNIKLGKKCPGCETECTEKHLKEYDFHHKNPKTKKFSISNGVTRGYGINKIKRELKKCILMCKECHKDLS